MVGTHKINVTIDPDICCQKLRLRHSDFGRNQDINGRQARKSIRRGIIVSKAFEKVNIVCLQSQEVGFDRIYNHKSPNEYPSNSEFKSQHDLRNEFIFLNCHGIMYTSGLLQNK